MDTVLLIGLMMASYLIGSISFGRILSAGQKVDVTKQGSGNTGATNMLRTYGAKLGLLTLLLDLIKGIVPALVGYFAFGGAGAIPDSYIGLYACGLAAVLGHIFPLYYKFKGGKAAATACGVFLVAQPVIALCAFVLCVGLAMITRYVSPMSLLFILINVVWQCCFMPEFVVYLPSVSVPVVLIVVALGCAVWAAHWQNIVRLVKGQENRTDIWGKITEKLHKKSNQNDLETEDIAQNFDEIEIENEKIKELNEDNEVVTEIKTTEEAAVENEEKIEDEINTEEENTEAQNIKEIDNSESKNITEKQD